MSNAQERAGFHAIYERIVVAGRQFVSARLTPFCLRPRIGAIILEVVMARPTGFNRADAINIRIPIERPDYKLTALGA